MPLGIVADVHGNVAALEAVIADGAQRGVDKWWALGDLVLFGPRPVETLQTLGDLPGIEYVSGNTDRYVRTNEQPWPHATTADAVGDPDLVERRTAMAGSIGWTRGALVQAGLLDVLAGLPSTIATTLDGGTSVLGVHASPQRDDGQGIDTRATDEDLARLLAGTTAHMVIGGHTHDPTDRMVERVRALNPGSVGIPHHAGWASWLLVGDGTVELHEVPFDVDAVVRDLYQRGYPSAAWLDGVLHGATYA